MRVFVAGNKGQLGTELTRATWPAGTVVIGADLPELDIANAAQLEEQLRAAKPDLIVNAAAYTAVDKSETEVAVATAVNATAPGTMARVARALDVPLVHVSTDYVFDGSKRGAYVEDDAVGPLGAYGRTKEAGERAVREGTSQHLILRTSWVFASHGGNFVRTMLRLAGDREVLKVVADQHGRPTCARELALAIVARAPAMVAKTGFPWGTYHFAQTGETTWHGFASEIIAMAAPRTGKKPQVLPITTADYPTPAKRPANSVLSTAKYERTFGTAIRSWRDSLAETVSELLPPVNAEGKGNS